VAAVVPLVARRAVLGVAGPILGPDPLVALPLAVAGRLVVPTPPAVPVVVAATWNTPLKVGVVASR
jgi:hypothetical protein